MSEDTAAREGASAGASVRDVAAYLCDSYPRPELLSNSRLTKMVYLADWKAALERGAQLTGLRWRFSFYGPYVPDVIRSLRSDPGFSVEEESSAYGGSKETVRRKRAGGPGARSGARLSEARASEEYPSLSGDDRRLLDFVVESVAEKGFAEFTKLVYSTYPVLSSERHALLDLPALADEYRPLQPLISG